MLQNYNYVWRKREGYTMNLTKFKVFLLKMCKTKETVFQ